ncbi:hypothetical protein IWZ00DRAFT_493063 [Phyllosticta capitalensis]
MAPLRETDGDGPAALPDNTTTAASVKSEANVPIPKPNPRLNPLLVQGESASAGSLRESQARGQHAAAAAPPPDDARLEQHLDALMARISDRHAWKKVSSRLRLPSGKKQPFKIDAVTMPSSLLVQVVATLLLSAIEGSPSTLRGQWTRRLSISNRLLDHRRLPIVAEKTPHPTDVNENEPPFMRSRVTEAESRAVEAEYNSLMSSPGILCLSKAVHCDDVMEHKWRLAKLERQTVRERIWRQHQLDTPLSLVSQVREGSMITLKPGILPSIADKPFRSIRGNTEFNHFERLPPLRFNGSSVLAEALSSPTMAKPKRPGRMSASATSPIPRGLNAHHSSSAMAASAPPNTPRATRALTRPQTAATPTEPPPSSPPIPPTPTIEPRPLATVVTWPVSIYAHIGDAPSPSTRVRPSPRHLPSQGLARRQLLCCQTGVGEQDVSHDWTPNVGGAPPKTWLNDAKKRYGEIDDGEFEFDPALG